MPVRRRATPHIPTPRVANQDGVTARRDGYLIKVSVFKLRQILPQLSKLQLVSKTVVLLYLKSKMKNINPRMVVQFSEAIADQVADSSSPEIKVLESEEKPVYTISILTEGNFSEERVSALPPFLIDRKGNLLKRFWHCECDGGYSEITSKHLSNIAVDSGLVIKLMTENLEVSQACICGDPPPFIIDRGGVYKRDYSKLGLAVRYVQVVSEHLSNIVVVSFVTPQEIHNQFKKVLDDLSEIDSSETFTQMLADNSFALDDDDMAYLIHQVEEMLAAVNAFVKTNA